MVLPHQLSCGAAQTPFGSPKSNECRRVTSLRLFHASFHDFSAWGLNLKRVCAVHCSAIQLKKRPSHLRSSLLHE